MKSPIILTALAWLAAGTAYAGNCPGEETNSPQLPAIVKVELDNPAVPSKPHPAMPSATIDRRSFVGASQRDGRLGLILTLAAPVPAGCRVNIDITDRNTTLAQLQRGEGHLVTDRIFDRLDSNFQNGLIAVGNGTNVLRTQFAVRARVTNAEVFTPEVRLITSRTGQTPPAAVPFSFEVRPFQIVSFTQAQTQAGPGARIEMLVTLNEMPVEGAATLLYKTSNTAAGLIDPVTAGRRAEAEIATPVDGGEQPPRDRTVFVAAPRPTLIGSGTVLVGATTQVSVQLRTTGTGQVVLSPAKTASLTIDNVRTQKVAVPPQIVTPPPVRVTPVLPGVVVKKTGS